MSERKRKSRDVVFTNPPVVLEEAPESIAAERPRHRQSRVKKKDLHAAGSFRSALGASFDKAKPILWFYTIYSILCFVLGILLSLSQSAQAFLGINGVMATLYGIFSNVNMFGLVLGGVAAVLLFGKYKRKNANDVFHSIAVRDRDLFWADYLTGLFTFLIPMAVGYVAQSVVSMAIEAQNPTAGVFQTFGVDYTLLLNFVFSYSIAVLALAITNSVVEGIIGYAALCSIPLIIQSFLDFMTAAVLGQNAVVDIVPKIKLQTTITLLIDLVLGSEGEVESYGALGLLCVIVVAVSAIFAFLAFLAFIKLRSHDSGDSKAKTVVSRIVVTFLSFYAGFLVLFFKRSERNSINLIAITITMLALGFVVQFLVNTLLHRNFRFPVRDMVPFAASAAVLMVLSVYYFSGGFGQITYMPETKEIKSVEFNFKNVEFENEVAYAYRTAFTDSKYLSQSNVRVVEPIVYSDKDSIKTITDYHKELLKYYEKGNFVEEELSANPRFGDGNEPVKIKYTLKSGKEVARYYNYVGSVEQVEQLEILECAENAVRVGESQVLAYIEGESRDDVMHQLYLYPLLPDGNNLEQTAVTDEQIRGLIGAIYEDEKTLDSESIYGSEGGDLCMFYIVPDSSMQDEFKAMVQYSGDSPEMLLVKSCYKKTISYLRDTLGLGDLLDEKRSLETVQITYGYPSAFDINTYWRYTYSMGSVYKYNDSWTNKMYLDTALDAAGEDASMHQTYNAEAIQYLKDHAKLSTSNPSDGMIFVVSDYIDTSYATGTEQLLFGDKRLYFVTQDEWDTFLSMCN